MPNGPRVLLEGACYHILIRGNQKQHIFKKDNDFREYVERMKRYKKRYGFKLYGFCLMPNHVHLFGEIEKQNDLAKFMHGINRSYTSYFNETYGKVGHLWQGRFKNKIVVKDRYLVDCINYIELNPVRANIVGAPQEYKWSSYKERNLGAVSEEQILDTLVI